MYTHTTYIHIQHTYTYTIHTHRVLIPIHTYVYVYVYTGEARVNGHIQHAYTYNVHTDTYTINTCIQVKHVSTDTYLRVTKLPAIEKGSKKVELTPTDEGTTITLHPKP